MTVAKKAPSPDLIDQLLAGYQKLEDGVWRELCGPQNRFTIQFGDRMPDAAALTNSIYTKFRTPQCQIALVV